VYRPRVIPVVLIDGYQAIKTIRFGRRVNLGDPVNLVSLFSAFRVDELVLLDIGATSKGRSIDLGLVREIASEAGTPFSIGGGVMALDQIHDLLSLGAERVVLSSVVYMRESLLDDAVRNFGSSSITVCIDVGIDWLGRLLVYSHSGKRKHSIHPIDAARRAEDLGAGEIIVQSIPRDGMMKGYDIRLLSALSRSLRIPVVALGGAGCLQHMLDVYAATEVSAVASGSLFIFKGSRRGVLPNYPSADDLSRFQGLRKVHS